MLLYDEFVKAFHSIVEDKFSIDFELSPKKELDSLSMPKDVTFGFNFSNNDFNQKIYYFIDKKFARNLFSAVINEIESRELDNDLTPKIINLLNDKVVNKLNNDLKINAYAKEGSLLTDLNNEIEKDISLSVYYLSSLKGGVFIGFVNKSKPVIDNSNLYYSKKTSSGNTFQNQIIQIKEKKDEASLISTVQLLEIKKQVLTSLNEIKDLKGDPDFLLRKAKTISELSRLWLDISKEEI